MQLSYGSKQAQETAYSKQQTAKKPRPTTTYLINASASSKALILITLFLVAALIAKNYFAVSAAGSP